MQQPDLDAFAETVVLTIKTAMGPVLERLATAEQSNRDLLARIQDLSSLRDRLVVMETKAAMTVPVPAPAIEPAPSVNLAPVLERIAAAEARLSVLGDLRDRMVTVETKAAIPAPIHEPVTVDLAPVFMRLQAAESALEAIKSEGAWHKGLEPRLADVRERVAALEAKPLQPGPQGEPGPSGKDGVNGKDGTAGLSYVGVYQEGKAYEVGEMATWGGSMWHCNVPTTTKPGDGSKDWTLMVKRGRDGKDGLSAPGALPVVKVG